MGRGTSVRVATRYGLDGPRIEYHLGGEIFLTRPDRFWGPRLRALSIQKITAASQARFLGITPVSSVSNGLYFLTLPLVSVVRVIYTSKGMLKKFGVHVIH
jgi:hypothetical protein